MKKNSRTGDFIRPMNNQPLGERLFKPLLSGHKLIQSKSGLKSRFPRTLRTTGISACLLPVLLLTVSSAIAFDPPRIIGHLTASEPSLDDFATDFVCVGDQNGDGYDDLLVNHDPYKERSHVLPYANRVELYFGGRNMDDQPDFVIAGSQQGPTSYGNSLFYIGRLTASQNPFWAIMSITHTNNRRIVYSRILIFEAGDALDDEPEFVLASPIGTPGTGYGTYMPKGRRMKPFDFNGDGFNDLISEHPIDTSYDPNHNRLEVYFGGEEFDTIPDWRGFWSNRGGCDAATGYNINGDRYDDILVRYRNSENDTTQDPLIYALYLGGNQPDTIPVWEFVQNRFEDTTMTQGFALVPDVNGDGYDDIAIQFVRHWWQEGITAEGIFLFYGGRNPDPDPDVLLPGTPSPWLVNTEITGGDINGDGYGDIIVTNPDGFRGDGSMQIYLGSRWFVPEPALTVNCLQRYGVLANGMGERSGGIGDYNGDRIYDFVNIQSGNRPNADDAQVYVLSGNRDWEVSVPVEREIPTEYQVVFSTNPNPFNGFVTLRYELITSSNIRLEAYDVSGRLIEVLVDDQQDSGAYSVDWQAGSGIYFISLVAGMPDGQSKKIVRKVVSLR